MKAALVTGAGGTLGAAVAERLGADGFALALTDIDSGSLAIVEGYLRRVGVTTFSMAVDICDERAIAELFQRTNEALGPLEVLVNNAAVYPTASFLETPLDLYDHVQRVNQRGYWIAAQHAAGQMVSLGHGAIVNVASITVHGGWPGLAAYVTTKGGISALTKALARELGVHEIRVNAVSPGAFPTAAERIHPDPAGYERHVLEEQALKRRGKPSELAAAVAFLCSGDASFITGQTLEVNGGWVMQ
jgi:NAD(P)-dependent dehydrogenase (short-subunit alcohol dehydrogenase family)